MLLSQCSALGEAVVTDGEKQTGIPLSDISRKYASELVDFYLIGKFNYSRISERFLAQVPVKEDGRDDRVDVARDALYGAAFFPYLKSRFFGFNHWSYLVNISRNAFECAFSATRDTNYMHLSKSVPNMFRVLTAHTFKGSFTSQDASRCEQIFGRHSKVYIENYGNIAVLH